MKIFKEKSQFHIYTQDWGSHTQISLSFWIWTFLNLRWKIFLISLRRNLYGSDLNKIVLFIQINSVNLQN